VGAGVRLLGGEGGGVWAMGRSQLPSPKASPRASPRVSPGISAAIAIQLSLGEEQFIVLLFIVLLFLDFCYGVR